MRTVEFGTSGFPCVSCFFFVRDYPNSNEDFLEQIGLGNYREVSLNDGLSNEKCVLICRIGRWLGLFENWGFQLQFSSRLHRRFELIGLNHDVVFSAIGESDRTFSFRIFEGGKLRRSFRKGDPAWGDMLIVEDFGEPMEFEGHFGDFRDEADLLPFVAERAGIPVELRNANFTAFAK